MKWFIRVAVSCLLAVSLAGCGVDNSTSMPEEPDEMPTAAPSTAAPEPMQAP